jgi:hypothetical protein
MKQAHFSFEMKASWSHVSASRACGTWTLHPLHASLALHCHYLQLLAENTNFLSRLHLIILTHFSSNFS